MMNFIKNVVVFLSGVFIGQEYGSVVPSVKQKTIEYYTNFTKSEFYKKIKDDFNQK